MGRIEIELPARRFKTAFERLELLADLEESVFRAGPSAFPEGEEMLKLLRDENQSNPARLTYRQEGSFVFFAAALFEEGRGEAFCLQCNTWYGIQSLGRQEVRYGTGGSLSGGEGRLWSCPHGHRVFEVYDSRA
jgi:hypothetical protein